MTDKEITLNLDIATDKLVTVKDYYEHDRINQKFAEFMEHEITHLVKKQLTETLGSALIEAINSTVVNLTPDEAQPLEQICINDLDHPQPRDQLSWPNYALNNMALRQYSTKLC